MVAPFGNWKVKVVEWLNFLNIYCHYTAQITFNRTIGYTPLAAAQAPRQRRVLCFGGPDLADGLQVVQRFLQGYFLRQLPEDA